MHKGISHNILENQRKNFFNEKEAKLGKKTSFIYDAT